MHIDYLQAYKFIYGLNNETRSFLQNNFITIRNGFINCGLIPYNLDPTLEGFLKLEKLYFSALKRNVSNRILTLSIKIHDKDQFYYFNEVVKWIKAKEQENFVKL